MPFRAGSRSKGRRRRSTKRKVSHIPPGFRTVTPYLAVNGGSEALEFYKKAFGAKESQRQTTPDGKIVHARMKIGDSIVMLSDQFGALSMLVKMSKQEREAKEKAAMAMFAQDQHPN